MRNKKGFTLVELLIVIALLGALAVGLLAALDPFEQLKKGTDTGTRNTVSEIQGAIIRYFALKSTMPFTDTTLVPGSASTYYASVIAPVVTAGELKADFSTLAGAQLGKIFMTGTQETLTVCFKPSSRSFRNDPNTKYDSTGSVVGDDAAVQATCFDNIANEALYDCYWCVK